jgi:hypothetical protein
LREAFRVDAKTIIQRLNTTTDRETEDNNKDDIISHETEYLIRSRIISKIEEKFSIHISFDRIK